METPTINSCYITNTAYPMNTVEARGWDTSNLRVTTSGTITHGDARVFFNEKTEEGEIEMSDRRIVKVFIVDPDEKVPLKDAVLYQGEEQLTDATDQELFFEIDIQDCLKKHNEKRLQIVDEKASARREKDVFLKEIRIRDLVMSVVEVARF